MSAKARTTAYEGEDYNDDDFFVGSQESFITKSHQDFEEMYELDHKENLAAALIVG